MKKPDSAKKNNKKKLLTLDDKKFRALIEKSFDVIVVVSPTGKVLYASPSIVHLYGRSYKEVIGANGLRYVHPIDLPKIAKLLTNIALNPGKLISVELRIKHKDGHWRWVKARASNLIKDQHIKGIVVNFHDITDGKQIEERKDEFISLASHELQTPITSLKAYVQILKKRYGSQDEFLRSCLEKINTQMDRLSQLVSGLMDVSRIQEGKVIMRKEIFSVDSIIREVVDDMRRISPGHTITIKKISRKKIFADKFRLTQVLINLISNAVKYSPKSSNIIISCSADRKNVSISVKDFGVGIRKENAKRIFERFFQDRNTRRQNTGLGLGLYVAATIIKQHGGRIWVKSEKHKGATFTFSIPISQASTRTFV